MESERGPVMDLPDRLQVQEAPSRPCSNWTFTPPTLNPVPGTIIM